MNFLEFGKHYMIKLLFKILHFESTPNHKNNVGNTFLFIWIFSSIIQYIIFYKICLIFKIQVQLHDYYFLLGTLLISFTTYYIIYFRILINFERKGLDKEFYDFGKLNKIIKPTILCLFLIIIVFLGRFVIDIT